MRPGWLRSYAAQVKQTESYREAGPSCPVRFALQSFRQRDGPEKKRRAPERWI